MDADSTQKPLSVILEEIEERANKATEGPWCWDNQGEKCDDIQVGVALDKSDEPLCGKIVAGSDVVLYMERIASEVRSGSDADFIASARTDIPALVKALRRAMGALREALNDSYTGSDEEACLHCGSVNTNADHALADITAILNQGRSVGDNKGSAA